MRHELLRDYINYHTKQPFQWGLNDCCLFAAKWVDLIKGLNIVDGWIGAYNDKDGAHKIIKQKGFSGVEAIADYYLTRIPLKSAKRGDLVSIEGSLGICDGRLSWFYIDGRGLIPLFTLRCNSAWGV